MNAYLASSSFIITTVVWHCLLLFSSPLPLGKHALMLKVARRRYVLPFDTGVTLIEEKENGSLMASNVQADV